MILSRCIVTLSLLYLSNHVGAFSPFLASRSGWATITTARGVSSGANDGGGDQPPNVKLVQLPADEKDMPFYTMGLNIALQVDSSYSPGLKNLLSKQEVEIFLRAFTEFFNDSGPVAKGLDPGVILNNFGQASNQVLQERMQEMVTAREQDGRNFVSSFMEKNKGAVRTDSGLVYLDMRPGNGASPTAESTVEVHYHGTMPDGSVFDSSMENEPVSFPIANAIKGWQEGLQLMKEGGKATLLVPPELAYGDAGSGPIPPGTTLRFEVELFKVIN